LFNGYASQSEILMMTRADCPDAKKGRCQDLDVSARKSKSFWKSDEHLAIKQ
jgi:hypothetical protein